MEKASKVLCIIEGLLMGIIGILFFTNPISSLLSLSIIIGIMIIIAGVLALIRAPKTTKKGWLIFRGIINILFGLLLCFSPISTIATLVIFYGAWALVTGIFLIISEIRYKTFGFNMPLLYAILLIILGILILVQPIVFLEITPYFIGINFIIIAIFEIYLGFKL